MRTTLSRSGPGRLLRCTVLGGCICILVLTRIADAASMNGTLRVSSQNPRYFTDSSGRAIYLTGSHTWNNLIDMDAVYPPHQLDYPAYLDFLTKYSHNFFRLWAWETTRPQSVPYERRQWASPQPWPRTGPGTDVTGLPTFDLSKINQPYFDRLRTRVLAAQARGIYVSVMLFEGYSVQLEAGKASHPFNSSNNINGIGYGSSPTNIHTLAVPAITAIQEAYVRKVIDTLNDCDNIMYEIANEAGSYSAAWQSHMISYVKTYEATKPKQHPVGATYQHQGGTDATLFSSTAEWISPSNNFSDYLANPPAADGSKVIISDTDHLGGSGTGDRAWVWKSFTRGLNTTFMDRYVLPDSVTNAAYAYAEEVRLSMGHTNAYARKMHLAAMTPQNALSSTLYCLANAAADNAAYLVYAPAGGIFTVNLFATAGPLNVEWFNPSNGATLIGDTTMGGATRSFTAPFGGDAVLYLYSTQGSPPLGTMGLLKSVRLSIEQ
jgi:hypothetical protein